MGFLYFLVSAAYSISQSSLLSDRGLPEIISLYFSGLSPMVKGAQSHA